MGKEKIFGGKVLKSNSQKRGVLGKKNWSGKIGIYITEKRLESRGEGGVSFKGRGGAI